MSSWNLAYQPKGMVITSLPLSNIETTDKGIVNLQCKLILSRGISQSPYFKKKMDSKI